MLIPNVINHIQIHHLRPKYSNLFMMCSRSCHLMTLNREGHEENKQGHKQLVKCVSNGHLVPQRGIFRFPFNPPTPPSKVKKYTERRVLGYSMEQIFEVVSRVEDYHFFLPACTKSVVKHREPGFIRADLEIGIPPIIWEKYTSNVTLKHPNLVKAVCADGKLFHYLETEWKLSPGLPNNKNTCTLDFKVAFEFKSALHSQLVHIFFDEMVRQTVNAFLRRAETLYGKQKFTLNGGHDGHNGVTNTSTKNG